LLDDSQLLEIVLAQRHLETNRELAFWLDLEDTTFRYSDLLFRGALVAFERGLIEVRFLSVGDLGLNVTERIRPSLEVVGLHGDGLYR
jgi:hypothetical protein